MTRPASPSDPASRPLEASRTGGGARLGAMGRATAWLLRQELRHPLTLLGLLGLGLLWALRFVLGELGIASADGRDSAFLYEVAFLAAAFAGALGLAVLARHRWVWAPLGRGERAAVELAFLLGGGGLWLALAWAPSASRSGDLPLFWALAVLLEVAAFAQLCSRLPWRAAQPAALLLGVWWIPALGQGSGGVLAELSGMLAGPAFAPGAGQAPIQALRAVDMAPAVASGLAAWLLSPKIPRP
jgi:hypothetical protein